MSRINFDQFSKSLLEDLLSSLGTVERSKEIPGEPKLADIYFIPASPLPSEAGLLGIFGEIIATACLLEPFRNPPSDTAIRDCLLKLLWLHSDLNRQAEREEQSIPDDQLAQVWILASALSSPQLSRFAASPKPGGIPGVYWLGEALKTNLISIRDLPLTPDTLWLRLLGSGDTQVQAIREVFALPPSIPYRLQILQLLAQWRITTVELNPNIDDDEEEQLNMALSQAFLEWEKLTEQRGEERGIEQGQRLVVENLLRVRFGDLDPQLTEIIPSILALPPDTFTPLLLQLSREELLARFGE
jgi:hypothetical protein